LRGAREIKRSRRFGFVLAISLLFSHHHTLADIDGRSRGSKRANPAKLLWQYDFHHEGLSLRTRSQPNSGVWMPNDQTWQDPDSGYEDFAATTCANDDIVKNVCNMPGGTFNINPNDPNTREYSPFSFEDESLVISAIRTPASLYPAIKAELESQGVHGPVPSFVGGRLMTNPNVFPGFRYGYFEFSVAFPNAGPGMFPALWFYATPGLKKNQNKAHAEIDLLEFFGRPDVFITTIHRGSTAPGNETTLSERVGQWPGQIDDKFHKYGMEWTSEYIKFYLDQKLIYAASRSAARWFRDVTLSPVINYAVAAPWMTSNLELRPSSSTPDILSMKVRYVKLYDKKPW